MSRAAPKNKLKLTLPPSVVDGHHDPPVTDGSK